MHKRLLLIAALLSSALPLRAQEVPAAQGAPAKNQRAILFSAWIDGHPGDLWADDTPAATKQAVADYNAKKALPSGKIYGASIRGLKLEGKTAVEIDALLKAKGFARRDDSIRDPKTHDPVLDAKNNPIPMLVYTGEDGAMVRVKPVGDPTFKIRPQPDVVKAVRNPPDGDYRDFAQEAFKVEAGGDRPIPKAPKELKNPYKDTPLASTFVDGWGDAAHADVKPEPAKIKSSAPEIPALPPPVPAGGQ